MSRKISLEKSIDRMEEIVELLESDELDLEKALKLFEEGINISKKCQQRINELEDRDCLLTNDKQGNMIEINNKKI